MAQLSEKVTARDTLTARQHRVLSYVRDYSVSHGYPPSLDDIATHLHLSRSKIGRASCRERV